MNVSSAFKNCLKENRAALITYYTAGFPDLKKWMKNMEILAESGADIIEAGIPFSDPVADGPVIQQSSNEALKQGVNLEKILNGLSVLKINKPVLLMSYLNPLLSYGAGRLIDDACGAGVSGFIIPDLPVEEAGEWERITLKSGLDLVFLAAPTSPENRLKIIAKRSRGFVYCVSIKGITGIRNHVSNEAERLVSQIQVHTDTPAAVGFGISSPNHAHHTALFADGVITGSRIIKAVQDNEDLSALVQSFRQACYKNGEK